MNDTTVDKPTSTEMGAATADIVRRAVAFIEANVHTDICPAAVAAAVSVSPGALKYAFVHHLGTSPYGHLRRVRLERAHFDLLAADPATGATVSAIAARWGFARSGNFCAYYRDTYGVSADDTLAI